MRHRLTSHVIQTKTGNELGSNGRHI